MYANLTARIFKSSSSCSFTSFQKHVKAIFLYLPPSFALMKMSGTSLEFYFLLCCSSSDSTGYLFAFVWNPLSGLGTWFWSFISLKLTRFVMTLPMLSFKPTSAPGLKNPEQITLSQRGNTGCSCPYGGR